MMRVVPTPPEVKPTKSRYVYRRKYDNDGSTLLLSATMLETDIKGKATRFLDHSKL